jgi:hypothetical protein
MSNEKDESKVGSFIKAHYLIIWKYNSIPLGLIYGRIENLTEESNFHKCTYGEEYLGRWCNLSRSTARKMIKWLIKEKYVVDETPGLKNKTHFLVSTNKFHQEESIYINEVKALQYQLQEQWECIDKTDILTRLKDNLHIVDPYMYEFLQIYKEVTNRNSTV